MKRHIGPQPVYTGAVNTTEKEAAKSGKHERRSGTGLDMATLNLLDANEDARAWYATERPSAFHFYESWVRAGRPGA